MIQPALVPTDTSSPLAGESLAGESVSLGLDTETEVATDVAFDRLSTIAAEDSAGKDDSTIVGLPALD